MKLRRLTVISALFWEGSVIATLLLLTILFYRDLLLHDRVLVSGDLFTLTHPRYLLLREALLSGRLALWNPSIYHGVPFLSDPTNAVLYPGSFLSRWLDPLLLTNVLVAGHAWLAAWATYLCGRIVLRLNRLGALGAGFIYAFSGTLAGRANDVNFVTAAAWLPAALTLLHLALTRRSPFFAALTAVTLTVQFLAGDLQVSYETAVLLTAYGAFIVVGRLLGPLWQLTLLTGSEGFSAKALPPGQELARSVLPLLFLLSMTALVAFNLVQMQWQPFQELLTETARPVHLSYAEVTRETLSRHELLRALLPSFVDAPSSAIAYTGFLTLALALLPLRRRPYRAGTWWVVGLAVISLLLALANPFLTRLGYTLLPGFAFFSRPVGWLLLYGLAVALLAGAGLDLLATIRRPASTSTWLGEVSGGLLLPALLAILLYFIAGGSAALPRPAIRDLWVGLAGVMFTLVFLLGLMRPGRMLAAVLLGILALELIATATLPGAELEALRTLPRGVYEAVLDRLPAEAQETEEYRFLSLIPVAATQLTGEEGQLLSRFQTRERDLDNVLDLLPKSLSLAPNLPLWRRTSTVEGRTGREQLLPTQSYSAWRQALGEAGEPGADVPADRRATAPVPAAQRINDLPDSRTLGLVSGRYVLADGRGDLTLNNIYFDLGIEVLLTEESEVSLPIPTADPVTSLRIMTYLSDTAEVPAGTEVLEIQTLALTGATTVTRLRAGIDTALGRYDDVEVAARTRLTPVILPGQGRSLAAYLTRVPIGLPVGLSEVRFRSLLPSGTVHIRALTLVDDRFETAYPIALDPDYTLLRTGAVKVYENRQARPRAYFVRKYEVVAPEEALSRGRELGLEGVALVTEPGQPTAEEEPLGLSPTDQVVVRLSSPERVSVDAFVGASGFLVLTDADYPGWKATVDGRPVPILRANGLVRAVVVPEGRHEVTFMYEPESFHAGLARSREAAVLLTLGVPGLWLAGRAVRRFQHARTHD